MFCDVFRRSGTKSIRFKFATACEICLGSEVQY